MRCFTAVERFHTYTSGPVTVRRPDRTTVGPGGEGELRRPFLREIEEPDIRILVGAARALHRDLSAVGRELHVRNGSEGKRAYRADGSACPVEPFEPVGDAVLNFINTVTYY